MGTFQNELKLWTTFHPDKAHRANGCMMLQMHLRAEVSLVLLVLMVRFEGENIF